MRSFMICTHQTSLGRTNLEGGGDELAGHAACTGGR